MMVWKAYITPLKNGNSWYRHVRFLGCNFGGCITNFIDIVGWAFFEVLSNSSAADAVSEAEGKPPSWGLQGDCYNYYYMAVSKNRGGGLPPKMDGENNGKPNFLMDDLGVPLFLETPI